MFLDNFKTCKETINMNKRKYDVDISNMHKNIYQIINNIKFPNKINTILEYKNVHNISIDILLYKPNYVLQQKKIFILNIIKDKYDTYNHCMYNNNSGTNTSYENLKINNILITMWNKNDNMIKSKEKGQINIYKYFSSIKNCSKNNIKGTKKQQKIKMNKNRKIINSNNIFNVKYIKSYFCTNVVKLSNIEKKNNNNNDNLKNNKENNLFTFIEKIKNFHLKNNKDRSTSHGNLFITVNVVISNDTLVPITNLLLLILDLHPTTYLGPLEAFTINFSSSSCFNTCPII